MHDVRVTDRAGALPVAAETVAGWVREVLDGESAPDASVSVTFLGESAMRRLNREALDRPGATDVIAFRLEHPGTLVGDVYICAAVAARACAAGAVPIEEELARLVVHGVLHVLDRDHPEPAGAREASAMWAEQEAYVRRLRGPTDAA
jgi:probable rRNA maturation factor